MSLEPSKGTDLALSELNGSNTMGGHIMASPYSDSLGNASEDAGRVAGYADQAVNAAKDAASDAADRITTMAKDAMDNPERFARESYNSVTRYTQEKPLEALAIAAGVAFVVGALWKK
jgi:ElaB/YqjD/DUF883 family membrane-anchored ribosome-binding protein